MLNLTEIPKNTDFIIENFLGSDDGFITRMGQVGFYVGEKVSLVRKAPIFKDPILFRVGESQIALTKKEASQVLVSVKQQ